MRIEYISDPKATPDSVRAVYGPEGPYRVETVRDEPGARDAVTRASDDGLGAVMLLNGGGPALDGYLRDLATDLVPEL